MGRIKTKLIKAVTFLVLEKHRDKFTTDYSQNKEILKTLIDTESKKLRNIIAGYLTRLKRAESKA
ncbi:MAG: 30S ribosomal protein S17e [Nanoarchaeota archaeon]